MGELKDDMDLPFALIAGRERGLPFISPRSQDAVGVRVDPAVARQPRRQLGVHHRRRQGRRRAPLRPIRECMSCKWHDYEIVSKGDWDRILTS